MGVRPALVIADGEAVQGSEQAVRLNGLAGLSIVAKENE